MLIALLYLKIKLNFAKRHQVKHFRKVYFDVWDPIYLIFVLPSTKEKNKKRFFTSLLKGMGNLIFSTDFQIFEIQYFQMILKTSKMWCRWR